MGDVSTLPSASRTCEYRSTAKALLAVTAALRTAAEMLEAGVRVASALAIGMDVAEAPPEPPVLDVVAEAPPEPPVLDVVAEAPPAPPVELVDLELVEEEAPELEHPTRVRRIAAEEEKSRGRCVMRPVSAPFMPARFSVFLGGSMPPQDAH